MATFLHPITGVELNPIIIERLSLTYNEAITAHIMRIQGSKYQHIAQFLGTNTHRLGEVFREEIHHGSLRAAKSLLN